METIKLTGPLWMRRAFWSSHAPVLDVLQLCQTLDIAVQVCVGMYKGTPEVSYYTSLRSMHKIAEKSQLLDGQETVCMEGDTPDALFLVQTDDFLFAVTEQQENVYGERLGSIKASDDKADVENMDGYTYNTAAKEYIYTE